ncbi:MAG: hypothetical protein CL666_09610 [Balneola sp.]|nr:hypothetical protein [Balneola sp.]|tara:strand:+ start:88255 stop:90864 length:2610 start_codon:yes stop_codon:yes gene_type:complete
MQHRKQLFRELLIILLGLIGLGWFFVSFLTFHPFSVQQNNLTEDEVVQKADSVLQSWQFESVDLMGGVNLEPAHSFSDSLQRKWGAKKFQKQIEQKKFLSDLPLLRWEVTSTNSPDWEESARVLIQFDQEGEVAGFSANAEFLNQQRPSNRVAVRSIFEANFGSYNRGLEDSLISGLTDYQHLSDGVQDRGREQSILNRLRNLRGENDARYYSMDNIHNLARFYLDRTLWRDFDLRQDSISIMDEGGIRFARTWWNVEDPDTETSVEITVDVLPAGSLKALEYTLAPESTESVTGIEDIISTISLFVIVLFSLWLLFVFYLRIKAHAIDTRPAMIIAVIAGFIVPGFWILQFANDFGLDYSNIETSQLMNGAMFIAVMGAISAVGFFVLTAVSDSITRQYWPEKLKTWDLVRRGLFKNKPVGWGLIQSIGVGGILAGILGISIYFIPGSYIPSGNGFIANEFVLPSIANLMVSSMMVLLIMVPVFLIVGNQIKGLTEKKWIIPVLAAVIFGVIDVLPFAMEPAIIDRVTKAVIGFALGYFYLRYDILPVVFGFFLFMNLLTTSKGWVLEGSPDANTFWMFVLFMTSLCMIGIYFIVKGTERNELPEYVPSYIEDQAKEQRVKQELAIARAVQQTFLPSKIHHLPGIDIAGVCIPAQETGGDYYDMIPIGKQRTAIAIGDVSGKGIKASFYMTFTKGVLHSLSALILSPVELLNQLNRLFNENATRGTFISMIYGILEADKRQFTFARAGHNPMLVIRANGDSEWLQPDGLGIGVAKGDNFIKWTKEATLKLNEGDVIILYTDGITEMLNPGNQFYGEEKLEKLVKGGRAASSEEIMSIIVDDVKEFKGIAKQHDDMTLVIIKADASVNQ